MGEGAETELRMNPFWGGAASNEGYRPLEADDNNATSSSAPSSSPPMVAMEGDRAQTQQIEAMLDQTKGVLADNIEKVLTRGQSIESIETASEGLRDSSRSFRQSAVQLKRQKQWENCKMYLMITFVVAVIVLIVVMFFCGVTFEDCKKID